ncbi:hypothetical protein MMC24_007852 [Lignoscripta atroalba]|nr:hypothetical protein [Lignoscripta atroalba]
MPRQGRRAAAAPSRSAPSRPTVAPARPNVTPPQQPTRPAGTLAHPPASSQQAQKPTQAGQSPGLFGQMASTAAGVAVGSSIGHAIGGFFGGGAAPAPAEAQQTDNAVASQANDAGYQSNSYGRNCEADAKSFASCMTETNGNLQSCTWYLEQLKACQSAASQY